MFKPPLLVKVALEPMNSYKSYARKQNIRMEEGLIFLRKDLIGFSQSNFTYLFIYKNILQLGIFHCLEGFFLKKGLKLVKRQNKYPKYKR